MNKVLVNMHVFLSVLILLLIPSESIATIGKHTYYCGFEQTCARNETDHGQLEGKCCQSCECEDVCQERYTCCPDKERRNDTFDVVRQQCVPAGRIPKGQKSSHFQRFYTRALCPTSFADSAIKDKCESDGYESLEDVIFASSEDGSVVYKNKFCGLCHGEKRTLPWNVVINKACSKRLFKEDITETFLIETVLTRCDVEFRSPTAIHLPTLCFDTVIDTCNTTGLWDKYDSHIETLCKHPSETLYYYKSSTSVFRNVYCYLCNSPENVAPKTCQLTNSKQITIKSEISLFNLDEWFNADPKASVARQSTTCRSNEVMDTFFGICRELYCPLVSVPVNGKCVRFLDGGFTYALTVRLRPRQSIKQTESAKTTLKSKFINIMRQLGFEKCDKCFAQMYLNKSINQLEMSEVYINFAVTQGASCKPEDIWTKITELEKASSNVKLSMNGTIIHFEAFVDHDISKQLYKQHFEQILSVGNMLSCQSIGSKRGSSCAKVILSMEEYRIVLSNHNNVADLLFIHSNDDVNGKIFVCCEKYIVEQWTSGESKRTSGICALIMLLFARTFGKL